MTQRDAILVTGGAGFVGSHFTRLADEAVRRLELRPGSEWTFSAGTRALRAPGHHLRGFRRLVMGHARSGRAGRS